MNKLIVLLLITIAFSSCYKLEDTTINYADGVSTLVRDLPGDTLATDGWEDNYENGDLYLRQRYYNSKWTDSIRFVPRGNEIINSAVGVNASTEATIKWLVDGNTHPATAVENNAYKNTNDGYHYIYRSGYWFQMEINGKRGTAENDGVAINFRGLLENPPIGTQKGYAYRDKDNNRVYLYNGVAFELMVNDANYNANNDFVQVEYSKSGKESGIYSMFLYRFGEKKQQFIRDNADSVRYLQTDEWDLAFAGDQNSTVYLNNGLSRVGPARNSPITKSSLIMYDYGYDFMDEAPEDVFFDNRPTSQLYMSYASEFGPGVNPWYEVGGTFISKPYPNRAYYLRIERIDPVTKQSSYRYGKLQLISMYKGAPEVLTDRYWPSPFLTFRYYIQPDGSRNIRTRD